MSAAHTLTPLLASSRAVARPIPEPAPVTMANFPSSELMALPFANFVSMCRDFAQYKNHFGKSSSQIHDKNKRAAYLFKSN